MRFNSVAALVLVGSGVTCWIVRYIEMGRGDMRAIAVRPLVAGIGAVAAASMVGAVLSPWTISTIGMAFLAVWATARMPAYRRLLAAGTPSTDIATVAPLVYVLAGAIVMALVGIGFWLYYRGTPKNGGAAVVTPLVVFVGSGIGLGIWEEAFDRIQYPHWRPGFGASKREGQPHSFASRIPEWVRLIG